MRVLYALFSEKGSREINEDHISVAENSGHYLFALADGLGGHGGGEIASALAVETVKKLWDGRQGFQRAPSLGTLFDAAQGAILSAQQEAHSPNGLKTTLVLLCIHNSRFCLGYVGDSRLYRFSRRDGSLLFRTEDHSVPQMLVRLGELDENKIRFHEDRNRLLRVLGMEWETPKYQLFPWDQATPGEAFLLCSDGFWEWVWEDRMAALLQQSASPGEWLERMAEEARNKGDGACMDNLSAIAVWME